MISFHDTHDRTAEDEEENEGEEEEEVVVVVEGDRSGGLGAIGIAFALCTLVVP